jgi:hypothetical protein
MSNVPVEGSDPAQVAPEVQKRSSASGGAHTTPPSPEVQKGSSSAEGNTTPSPSEVQNRSPSAEGAHTSIVPNSAVIQPPKWRETWGPTIQLVIPILALVATVTIYYKQSGLTQKSLRVSERAYVGVETVTADLENREILIKLQNIGHVPASTLSLQGQHIRATTKETDPQGAVFRWDAGAVELFPGTPMPVVVSLENVEQSELDAILSKTKILYIGGTIQYDDGFGNHEKTTFAFRYDPPPKDRWIAHSDLSKTFKDLAR